MDKQALLKNYFRKRRNENLSDKTLADDKDILNKFLEFLGERPITAESIADYQDYIRGYTFIKKGKLCHYSKYSIYHIESKVKKFVNFIDPALGVDVKPKMPKTRKLPEDMLSEKDIEALLNACLTLRDKALISFLYESGCRKGELFSIEVRNVVFDPYGAVVTLPKGKTGARRIRVVFSASYLRQYIEAHPNKKPDSPLFCSTRKPFGKLSDSGLKEQLKEIAGRAGIGKNVFPHLLRHSRATELAKHLTEQQMKTYLGWTPGSEMASTYVHLSGQDIDPAILKMNGIETPEEQTDDLKTVRCPRCKELNPASAELCYKCFANLDPAAMTQELEEREEMKKQVEEIRKAKAELEEMKNNFEMLSQLYEQDTRTPARQSKPECKKIILLDDGKESL